MSALPCEPPQSPHVRRRPHRSLPPHLGYTRGGAGEPQKVERAFELAVMEETLLDLPGL
ncbi:hypothetical protein FRACA_4110006 [Frankia canadensis]|uniref:Uncharacterized protein n=1 Tax=Frankia canadensis TaxID=1836972 RepID=A0A2I2KWZ8_9ACTN|nr:hypothetical protein FRACA_4110006 [Frankia canadensis]SOU57470.1 hypothetical protein FRACA_4110006 [Frankia canadensis]